MMRLLEQTREEKIKMYMKLTKRELAEMLANANKALEGKPLVWEIVPPNLSPPFFGPNNLCHTR